MEIIGKWCVVYCSDGKDVARKQGRITTSDDYFLILDESVLIPKHRVVRVEVEK